MSTTIESLELQIKSNSKSAAKGIDALTQSLEALGKATANLGLSGVAKDTEKLNSTLEKASSTYSKMSSSLSGASSKFKMIGTAIVSVGKKIMSSIKKSSDYVENVNLFTVAMGEYAGEAKAYAESVSEVMGIDPGEWMGNQGIFQTLATGFGVAGDRASVMSQNLTQLGYDLSSFYNISVTDAMQKLKSGFAGELEPLRAVGYDLSQAKLEATALSLGIDKSVSSMTQAEKAQLRYYAIMTQVTEVQGDMARTLESPANQMRIFKAQVEMAAREIGNIFIPALNAILPVAIAITKVIRELASNIASLFGYEMPDMSTVTETAVEGTGAMEENLEGAEKEAKKLKSYMLGIDELNVINPDTGGSDEDLSSEFDFELPTYDFIGEATNSRVEGLKTQIESLLQPFTNLVTVTKEWIAQLDFEPITTRLGTFTESLNSAAEMLGSAFLSVYTDVLLPVAGWIVEVLLPTMIDIFNETVEWAEQLNLDALKEGFDEVGASLEPVATLMVDLLSWVYTDALLPLLEWALEQGLPAVFEAIANALDLVKAAISPVIEGIKEIKPVLEPIASWIGDVFLMVIEELSSAFEKVAEVLEEKSGSIKGIITGLGEVISVLWSGLKPILDFLMDWVKDDLAFIADQIALKIETAIDVIAGLVDFVAGVFTGDWERAWNGLSSAVTAVFDYIVESAELVWERMKEGWSDTWNAIMSVLSPIGEWINANVIQSVVGFFEGLWTSVREFFVQLWIDVTGIWSTVANWFNESVVQPIVNFFEALWISVAMFFSDLWDGICSIWESVATWFDETIIQPLVSFFEGALLRIGQFFEGCWIIICAIWLIASTWFNDNVITPIVEFFKGLWTSVSGFFVQLWSDIALLWGMVSTWFNEWIITPIVEFFKGLWTSVSEFFSQLWEDIKKVWSTVATWFNDKIITPVKTAFKTFTKDIEKFFSNLWEGIKDVWETVSTWFDTNIIEPVKTAFKTACESIGKFFDSLWLSIRQGVAGAMNGVIGGIESAINWIVRAINSLVGGFNTIVQWAADILGEDWGGVTLINEVKLSRIEVPKYAEGGFPEQGQMFIAREAGAEMVGSIGRRTAVANNDQIVAGIASGVAEANGEQNVLLREQNSLLRALLEKDSGVYLDGKNLTNSVEKYQRERGRVLITGGVI